MLTRIALCVVVMVVAGPAVTAAQADEPSSAIVREFAPTGKLRAAINFGNSVLAQRSPTGEPAGISVDLARELGKRLGVPVELVVFEAAGKVTEAVKSNVWDVAFVAIDPVRATDIAFTKPYVVIEGAYMVAKDSPLQTPEDVDRPGTRISVGQGSAYDLFLSREIKHATLVRSPTSPGAIDRFVSDRLEVAANVKQPLVAYAAGNPAYRVLPRHFMVIEQAMAMPRGREAAHGYLQSFIADMKASGMVADSLRRSNQTDAAVAP